MKKLDCFAEQRRKIVAYYDKGFAGHKNIITPYQHSDCLSSWHLYMIQVPKEIRKQVFDRLWEAEIGVNVHYILAYKHPYYLTHGYAKVCCPNAEEFYARAITLPLYVDMTQEQVEYVVDNTVRIVDKALGEL